MKLQSQKTMRFDPRELRRLARRSRPWRTWEWAVAGAFVGVVLTILARIVSA